MARSRRRWIQSALAGRRKGALHRQLGVPQGEKIPEHLLREAAAHPERFCHTAVGRRALVRRATLALTLRRLGGQRRRGQRRRGRR